jgi:hypothetical protein
MKFIERQKFVKDTDEFIRGFNYRDITKEEAHIALQYAKEKYGLLIHDIEYLDNKADLLIKYVGVVVGGLGAISGYLGLSNPLQFLWMTIVGIVAGILAMCLALWVRKPVDVPSTMSVQTLFKIIREKKGDQIPETALALAYEKAMVRLKELGRLKGIVLVFAYALLIAAIGLLFLGLSFRVG